MLCDITEDTELGYVSFTISSEETSVMNKVRWEQDNAGSPVYDLQGRKIHSPLQPGVYIIHGKKMLVK